MVTLLDRSDTGVNVVSIGVVPGVSPAATDNTALLNQFAANGYSIYFPPGEYYINSAVAFNGANNVKMWGDGARIYNLSDSTQMFTFTNCDKVEVQGLTFHTFYYLNRTSTNGASVTTALLVDNCKAVRLHNNVVEGFQCHAMRITGGSDISVANNTFLDGHWLPGGSNQQQDTACIKFWIDGTNSRPRDVVITGNQCNTKALIGISAQHATQKTVVANNSCIARETNGTLITGYVADAPKAGIEMQYYADASRTYVGADNDDFDQLVITGNNVSGCRFSGITGQSSLRANAVHPGARAIVSSNTVRYCGTSNQNNTGNLTGGINWIGYRDLVVSNNIIKNIPNDQLQANGSNALCIQGIWARTDGSANLGTPTSCVVTGNIITDCQARGVYITSESSAANPNSGDITLSDNIIQDINNNDFIRVQVPAGTFRAGHVHITGNKIASTKTVGQYIMRVEVGTTEPAECIIANNTCNFRDATFSTTTRPIIETSVTKAIISGNRIIGNGDGIGLNLRSLTTGQRFDQMLINSNSIDSCNIGVGSSNGATYGPFLLSNTTITNSTTSAIQNPRSVKHGHWENGKAIMYDDVDPTVGATAPEGTYLAGDSIQNTLANSTNDVTGWFSTGSGGWVPGVQIP